MDEFRFYYLMYPPYDDLSQAFPANNDILNVRRSIFSASDTVKPNI